MKETEIVRLRLTTIDEYQFLPCLKQGLWGKVRTIQELE